MHLCFDSHNGSLVLQLCNKLRARIEELQLEKEDRGTSVVEYNRLNTERKKTVRAMANRVTRRL